MDTSNSSSNLLDKAYIYLKDYHRRQKPLLKKFSECEFGNDDLDGKLVISYVNINGNAYDKVLDVNPPHEELVSDLADLRCSTPLELFIELHLRNALMLVDDLDDSEKKAIELNSKILELKKENEMLRLKLESIKNMFVD